MSADIAQDFKVPPEEEYPELEEYRDEEKAKEERGDDDQIETRRSKIETVVDKIAGGLKGATYAVFGALEMWKLRLPGRPKRIPYAAIGAMVANVIDKAATGIKVFFKVITPAEGRAETRNADTALLGQTVREKSPVPVAERIKTVFGKAGAAVRQVVHGVVDRVVPGPVRKAIAGGVKKVAAVVAGGVRKAAQTVKGTVKAAGGFFRKIFG